MLPGQLSQKSVPGNVLGRKDGWLDIYQITHWVLIDLQNYRQSPRDKEDWSFLLLLISTNFLWWFPRVVLWLLQLPIINQMTFESFGICSHHEHVPFLAAKHRHSQASIIQICPGRANLNLFQGVASRVIPMISPCTHFMLCWPRSPDKF